MTASDLAEPDRAAAASKTRDRLVRFLVDQPAVKAAWFASLHFPITGQYTTPIVALELDGTLTPDAFAGWPASDPIVVMGLAADAVSRMIQLSEPIYRRSSGADALAISIATAVEGSMIRVPSDYGVVRAVSLPTGEVPILIRDFGHSIGVGVADRSWSTRSGEDPAALIGEVAEAAKRWQAERPGKVTIVELGLHLARGLALAFADRWSLSIPGTADPRELWLHGEDREASAVGVFPGSVVVWQGNDPERSSVAGRQDLERALAQVIKGAERQRLRYTENIELSREVREATARIASDLELAPPSGKAWSHAFGGIISHSGAEHGRVYWVAKNRIEHEVARIFVEDGEVRAEAGLHGDGWRGPFEATTPLGPLSEAIRVALETLTLEKLEVGARYKVIAPIGQLVSGATVTFRGLDDIDNHYGEYVFESESGDRWIVAGDCSSRAGNPLREVHKHLAPV
jgi:hypothetical protein